MSEATDVLHVVVGRKKFGPLIFEKFSPFQLIYKTVVVSSKITLKIFIFEGYVKDTLGTSLFYFLSTIKLKI